MEIKTILMKLARQLEGHNALIQLQIDGLYYSKRVGDINKLIDKPQVVTLTDDRSFLDWMESEINQERYSTGTIANHRAALAIMRQYEPRLTFSSIDFKLICNFEKYLHEKGYAINTIAKFMKIFKKFVNLAIDNELMSTYPFRKYRIRSEHVQKQSLTERELHRIEQKFVEAVTTDEEKIVLQGFLFSVYTGLRYSDIIRVTKQHVKTIRSNKWLVVRMKKTELEVRIPLSKMFGGAALALLKDNKTTTGRLFQLPPNARTNILLRRIFKRAGMHRSMSFHCARHTCATLLLGKGVSLPVIQHILGHQSIKTTQIYSAVKDTTIQREIKRAFRRM